MRTAHDVAEWAGIEIDWGKLRDIITEGWSKELDDILMPCARKEENGWLMTPVFIIDDKVAFMGSVPDKEDIKQPYRRLPASTRALVRLM